MFHTAKTGMTVYGVIPTGVADCYFVRAARTSATEWRDRGKQSLPALLAGPIANSFPAILRTRGLRLKGDVAPRSLDFATRRATLRREEKAGPLRSG